MKVWKEVLRKNFILMIIAMIICGTAQMAVNTNSAAYAVGVLGLEQARFGTVVAIAGIVVVVLYPLLGILCDKMRHGLCGAVGAVLLALGFILYMQSTGFASITIARCIQMAGFGFVINAALSIAAASVRPEIRSVAMTLYGLGPALSYFTGPQTGTAIFAKFGFRTMFIACAVLSVAGAVIFLLNTSKPVNNPDAPKRKAFGFEKTALPGFILSFLILQIVFIGQTYATVSLLERGIEKAALFWTVGAVINVFARFFMSGIITKIGINKMFYCCVALLVISVICIAKAPGLGIVILASVCWGVGYNGTQAAIMSISVLRAPADRVGQANSTHQIGHNLAQVVWAQVAGILAGVFGYQGMFLFMLIPIAAGIIFFIAYVHRMVNRVEARKAAA
ncbi:major facilitator superfamily transporter [uncultured Roseburia sp.]|uniref:MFS transporter n=1 Tax=Brotonthovivens ammoniilytica TaxID=2981725 RepID=A0ABT2TNG9_9FIRM|nr:MFS transporter [Brotonthovivens ammoniilytica]MCU6763765.1 MFS transporter [Brotonthovivens ammoniilytica]SCJ34215.1 major facilitator superfamily transporter [uncultured Roseburia sp.]